MALRSCFRDEVWLVVFFLLDRLYEERSLRWNQLWDRIVGSELPYSDRNCPIQELLPVELIRSDYWVEKSTYNLHYSPFTLLPPCLIHSYVLWLTL